MDLYADSGNVFRRLGEQAKLPNEFICDVAVRLLQRRGYVFSGFRSRRPSYSYHEISASSPGMTCGVTRKLKEVLEDEHSDKAIVGTVSKNEFGEGIRESRETQMAALKMNHVLPLFKGVVTEVRWELDKCEEMI
jgi:hypothetical protein